MPFIDPQHHHWASQIIEDNSQTPIDPAGGATGPTGSVGATGVAGSTGTAGATGTAGPTGATSPAANVAAYAGATGTAAQIITSLVNAGLMAGS